MEMVRSGRSFKAVATGSAYAVRCADALRQYFDFRCILLNLQIV